jgi:long-subunit acyl-CoA synthetase (AMP-forming)
MSRVIEALQMHARSAPERPALRAAHRVLTYRQLAAEVERVARELRRRVPAGRSVALLADNGSAWVIADLAALMAEVPIVPLPTFFSPKQFEHALVRARVGYVICDVPERLPRACIDVGAGVKLTGGLIGLPYRNRDVDAGPPAGAWKITFTSGTTGEPKGVCLSVEMLETTAESLRVASRGDADDRHLCVLPLATLLENIGGIYAPLLAGATICVAGLADIGFIGSSNLDVPRFVAVLGALRPTSAILVPQLLQALVRAGQAGLPMPSSLRHLAVGGAPIALRTLQQAQALGLPVFEGYGLSECGSVVTLNRIGAHRPGSVGKPLPHVRLSFSAHGEVLVHGAASLGYLGEMPRSADAPVATGDLGHLDADGFLHLDGRLKNVFVTSFGRNIAPEWVESELIARPEIAQAALFGEARPFNTAIIVPRPGIPVSGVIEALRDINEQLPDYARVHAWMPATSAFTPENGLATANGRLRREAIFSRYAGHIDALYQRNEEPGFP